MFHVLFDCGGVEDRNCDVCFDELGRLLGVNVIGPVGLLEVKWNVITLRLEGILGNKGVRVQTLPGLLSLNSFKSKSQQAHNCGFHFNYYYY